ncbi:MAG: methionyl-tRNA formyltransferase [Erysipelotrichaceae bacterium]|nr:methionyl-tRNA formyltransferase [Erysipelotrichaceae bacterium]
MEKIKVIFMGTPQFACSILQQLIDDQYTILAVVSQPDKKVGRKQIIQQTPVKKLACQYNIPVLQPISIQKEYDQIIAMQPDLIVTCAYGQFIPEVVLQAPTYGSINVHASLLPKLRGGAPIHKAIIYGYKESGISIMRMIKKMDAGAVMSQVKVPIEITDTAGDLHDKLMVAGAKLLSESIPLIINQSAQFVEQVEEEATFAYNISKEEEFIHFLRPLDEVYNHVRGLIPFPSGYGIINGKKIKFHKVCKKEAQHQYCAGTFIGMMDDAIAIACQGGFLLVYELQMEGKTKVDAKSFYNGSGKQFIDHIFLSEVA